MSNNQKHVMLLNGPNLNMLGKREPAVYGSKTLSDIETDIRQQAEDLGLAFSSFQSNSESELINTIHNAFEKVDFILINPAAFTHYSVALRDALLAVNIPFIEIHISNVHAREEFRHKSYFSDIAKGVICGLGIAGYSYALQSAADYLNQSE